jgi:hypothetical protein
MGQRRRKIACIGCFGGFPSIGLGALGEAIKIYKLRDHSGIAAFKMPPQS